MFKTQTSLNTFCRSMYKYYKVIIRCKKISAEDISIDYFFSQIKGNGKIVIEKLINYARDRNYKRLLLRACPLSFENNNDENIKKLISYYELIGFKLINPLINEMEMVIKNE